MIKKAELKGGNEQHIIWQTDNGDGIPEAALRITEYRGSRNLEIRQDKKEIMVNFDTLPELIKVLRYYQRKG